jgi:hypothetical protein
VTQRVYKSTSEDREGDLVNVILEPSVYIPSPFVCQPSLKSSWRDNFNWLGYTLKSTHETIETRMRCNGTHSRCVLPHAQARRIVVPDFLGGFLFGCSFSLGGGRTPMEWASRLRYGFYGLASDILTQFDDRNRLINPWRSVVFPMLADVGARLHHAGRGLLYGTEPEPSITVLWVGRTFPWRWHLLVLL